MTHEKQETREEEVARVRSYLASQAIHRTLEQLVETLREAHRQFLGATVAVFHTIPREREWSAADVLAYICTIAAYDDVQSVS